MYQLHHWLRLQLGELSSSDCLPYVARSQRVESSASSTTRRELSCWSNRAAPRVERSALKTRICSGRQSCSRSVQIGDSPYTQSHHRCPDGTQLLSPRWWPFLASPSLMAAKGIEHCGRAAGKRTKQQSHCAVSWQSQRACSWTSRNSLTYVDRVKYSDTFGGSFSSPDDHLDELVVQGSVALSVIPSRPFPVARVAPFLSPSRAIICHGEEARRRAPKLTMSRREIGYGYFMYVQTFIARL